MKISLSAVLGALLASLPLFSPSHAFGLTVKTVPGPTTVRFYYIIRQDHFNRHRVLTNGFRSRRLEDVCQCGPHPIPGRPEDTLPDSDYWIFPVCANHLKMDGDLVSGGRPDWTVHC